MNKRTNIEQYLKEQGSLTYTFKGKSMNPMLKQGRDLFTIVHKKSERCKRFDVVMYRRPGSPQYVLHRIIDVRDTDYVIMGDNCINKEYGIGDEDIIGVMTSFMRKGKVIDVSNPGYRLYVSLWMVIHPMLIMLVKIKKIVTRGLKNA